MYKGFWKGLIVGILLIVIIVLVKFLVDYLDLSLTILWVVMAISMIAYVAFLVYLIEQYTKYIEKKKKEKKEDKTVVNIKIKPKFIEEKKEIIKPRVVEKIIDIPSGDLSFTELKDYIKYNLYYGRNAGRIRQNLLDVGWNKEEIDRAFDEVGEIKPIANVDAQKIEKVVDNGLKKEIIKLRREVRTLKSKPKIVKVNKPIIVAAPVKKKQPTKIYSHRFVGSKEGGKYHTYNCHWGDSIEKKKQRFFKTKSQAQRAGYSACRSCMRK